MKPCDVIRVASQMALDKQNVDFDAEAGIREVGYDFCPNPAATAASVNVTHPAGSAHNRPPYVPADGLSALYATRSPSRV